MRKHSGYPLSGWPRVAVSRSTCASQPMADNYALATDKRTNVQTNRQTDRQRHRVKPSVLRRKVNDVHWYVTMIVGLCAQTQHHCYYTGSVRGPTYSTAAFSTCHGIVLVSFPQSSHPVILTHMPHVFYLYFA